MESEELGEEEAPAFDRLAFGFLSDPRHPWGSYYRWRLFSLAHGDGLDWWSAAPCRIVEGGRRFVPPPPREERERESGGGEEEGERRRKKKAGAATKAAMATATGDQAAAAAAAAATAAAALDPLPAAKLQQLLLLLSRLTFSRSSIAEAMEWCLRESGLAPAVAEVILGSRLTKFWLRRKGPRTEGGGEEAEEGKEGEKEGEEEEEKQPPPPPPAHIAACLLLASDVLANSASPRAPRGASRWRLSLASLLPEALEALAASVAPPRPRRRPHPPPPPRPPSSSPAAGAGRMKQEACRVVVGKLLRAWRATDAFEAEFVDGLAASFYLFSPEEEEDLCAAGAGDCREKLQEQPPVLEEGGGAFSSLTDKEVELLASRSGVSLRGGREARLRRVARARGYGAKRVGG